MECLLKFLRSYQNLQNRMSILKEIYNYKLDFVKNQKKIITQKHIIDNLEIKIKEFAFYSKLKKQNNKKSIIGELKRASPSLGKFVNKDINIVKIAKSYEDNNISCLSVLTDEKYFSGSIDDLVQIREKTSLPILRKDFIVDEYQIYESKLYGADCILIILSMLQQSDADKFSKITTELNMDTIIEVHNKEELQRAETMKSNMIGINNRDLNNFVTDIETTIKLASNIHDKDKLIISESGFSSKRDIDLIYNKTNISNFLIGEFLMKSDNLPTFIENLLT